MNLRHLVRAALRVTRERYDDIRSGEFGKTKHWLVFLLRHWSDKYPSTISLEPINSCNLNCEFCSTPPAKLDRPPRAITLKEAKPVIRQIADLTHDFWLFLAGEPFLNKEIIPMISYASSQDLHTTVSTNGNLLNEEIAEGLMEAHLDKLIISLDGVDQDSLNEMRPGADFDHILKMIKYLIQQKEERHLTKPRIEIQMLVAKSNQSRAAEFRQLAQELNVDYCFKTLAIPTWILPKKDCQQIMEKYVPINETARTRYQQGQQLKKYRNCRSYNRPVILSNGEVTVCCYDPRGSLSQGNVFHEGLASIWRKPSYQKLRQQLKKRQLPLCKVCGETYDLS